MNRPPPILLPESTEPSQAGFTLNPQKKPFPGIWGGVLLIVLVQILANVVAGLLITGYMVAKHVPLSEWAAEMPRFATLGIIANSLGFGIVTYVAWRVSKVPGRITFPLKPVHFSSWLPMVPTMAGALLFASDAENVIVRILPPPEFVKELFGQLVGKGNGPAELFFLAIVAPVTEELLFRGVMLTGFLPRYGRGRTMIGTAFLFGLIHLNPWQFVPAFILGVLFAWWRIESNSLWPPLVAHAITNGSAYFLNLGQDPADVFNPEAQPVWLSALGIALLSGGLWWSVQVYRGSARRNAAVEVPL